MAHIVNPYNLDDDDDAVFSALLSQGLIWIEDDEGDEDGKRLESEIEVLVSITKGKTRTLNGHIGSVNDVAISGDFAISASSDKTLRVWNWKTGQHLHTLNGHTSSVNNVAISGHFAISASSDKTLRVWNWKTGQHLRIFSDDSTHRLTALALDGDFVFAVSLADVWIWNWKTGEHLGKLAGWQGFINDVAVDGDLLLSASADLLLVRNWRTGENLHKLRLDDDSIQELENLAVNNDFAIFIDYDSISVVWNWKTGEHFHKSELRNKSDNKIDNRVFSASSGMGIYDRKTNKWYLYYPDDMNMGVFSDDYSHIITGDDSGIIHVARVSHPLLRLITGKTVAKNPSHNDLDKGKTGGNPIPEYSVSDVIEAARDYIRKRDEEWVNFSRVSQQLHQTYPDLKKNLRQPNKSYKNLLQLLADHPSDFELRQDIEKQGLYWIRLKQTR